MPFSNKNQDSGVYVFHSRENKNMTPGRIIGPVIHDVYIISSCTEGFATLIINGYETNIKAGDIYFLKPGDSVIIKNDKVDPRRGVYCAANGVLIGEVLAKAGITDKSPLAPRKLHKPITEELYKIFNSSNDKDSGAEYRQIAALYNIFGMLLKSVPLAQDSNIFIKKAINIMESRYHSGIDVQALADEIGFSRCYFSTVFKKETGVSPYEYLTSLRIKKACRLLKSEDMPISDIAYSVGLDPRNFSRLFKKEKGMTPHEYIKEKSN